MSIFCISVRTGAEEKFKKNVDSLFETFKAPVEGTIYLLKKKMRLKTGKEYFDLFFPGYVFFETEENDASKFRFLRQVNGFLRFLPSSQEVHPLVGADLEIVKSILNFGTTVGIVPVAFDANDRIVIVDGPFKDMSGKVVSVNRRNKRVNIELEFMGGVNIVGLSYELVQKL